MIESQFDMFAPPAVRRDNPSTSLMAAKRVEWTITLMQQTVLQHIKQMGPVTAAELEELPVFAHCAPSTVRKRISELKQHGVIESPCKQAYTTKSGRRSYGEAYVVKESQS